MGVIKVCCTNAEQTQDKQMLMHILPLSELQQHQHASGKVYLPNQ